MYEKIELLVRRKWAKFRRSWFMRYFISSIVERIMLLEEDIWIDNWEEERNYGEEQMIVETFSNPIEVINNIRKIENIYTIKIKSIGCKETNYKPYVSPYVIGNHVRIGNDYYSLKLIEYVVFRCKEKGTKKEYQYQVASEYFLQFFEEEYRSELEVCMLFHGRKL